MILPNLRGRMWRAAARAVAKIAVEVDVDHAVPALVGVALERAVLHPRPLAAGPRADETDARIDAGVRERDVEPAVRFRRLVDRAIEGGVIGHVGDRAPHVEPFALQAGRLRGDRVGVDVDQRHPRAVRREHLAVCEPEPAGTAGDDHAEPGHVEPRGNVHAPLPPVMSFAGPAYRAARRRTEPSSAVAASRA